MKNLLACLAVFTTLSIGAQSTMPWNPDANDDSYVGATDMLSTLAVYGQQVGIDSSLTCDYEGSTLESFLGDYWSNSIVIDSLLVQYHLVDSALVWIPGCPDPITDFISLERAYIMYPSSSTVTWRSFNSWYLGHYRNLHLTYSQGVFGFNWQTEGEIASYAAEGFFGCTSASAWHNISASIPFPENWILDATGIQVYQPGVSCFWPSYNTYFSILPYWHYAE